MPELDFDPHLLYKYHLGHHVGKVSSFNFRNTVQFKQLYDAARNDDRCFSVNPNWHDKAKLAFRNNEVLNLWEDIASCEQHMSAKHFQRYELRRSNPQHADAKKVRSFE